MLIARLKSSLILICSVGTVFYQINATDEVLEVTPNRKQVRHPHWSCARRLQAKKGTSATCSFSERRRTSGSLLILARLPNDGNWKNCQRESIPFLGNKTTYPVEKKKRKSPVVQRYICPWKMFELSSQNTPLVSLWWWFLNSFKWFFWSSIR